MAALFIAIGAAEALWSLVLQVTSRAGRRVKRRKAIWVRFAIWLLLALEFELAADVLRTAISPTWDDVGMLAAIAAIRTVLNYFLEKDLDKYRGRAAGRRLRARAGRGAGHHRPVAGTPRSWHSRESFSTSSITRFIFLIVSSSGSSVVMSTPASFRSSIGYFEPPADSKVKYRSVAAGSPARTFSDSAADAVNEVAYWKT